MTRESAWPMRSSPQSSSSRRTWWRSPFSDDRKHAGAIAILRGGDSDGDIVYVHSDDKPSNLPKSVTMSYEQPALSHLKAKDCRSVSSRIQGALQSNADDVRGVDETSAGLYR